MAEDEVGLADAVLLAPLTEDSFLHNLHVRYKRDIIYTYVGNALISVNPCRPLPLYSADLVRTYLARPPYLLPPHLYAITATAYRWVRDRNESQCIVITGESGAGKTEAARVCLQCAVVAGGSAAGAAGGGAAATLVAAGTLLEAFGNAATARNHNASRFGKLLDIELDFKGEPIGGHLTHYLLEKERVCFVSDGERNFHVLYQLLAGADAQLLKRLKLQRSWEAYRVLRGRAPPAGSEDASPPLRPPPGPADPHADRDHFAFTKAAMKTLGLSAAECGAVLRILAFILKLGNVRFEPLHHIDGSIGARAHHELELRDACALVGVDPDTLALALGAAPEASVPPPAAPPTVAPHEDECSVEEEESSVGGESEAWSEWGEWGEWAALRRDRVLCALYSRLFNWLVRGVNAALRGAAGGRRSLGILDVYGLESLAHNSLERLLINYAAERVHAAVCTLALRRQQEEYAREGLAWTPVPLTDHEAAADALDAGPDCVLAALRDATLRAAPDSHFIQRLQRRRHPRVLPLPPDRFQITHFGGVVVYSARGIISKNRDSVCRRCATVLAAAREPLLAALFAAPPPPTHAAAGSPRRAGALACRQRALIAALLRRLPPAPRLVRCLRADTALRPHRFDAPLLRHQIRTQGIVEMAALRRAGWCESLCARGVVARYGILRWRRSTLANAAATAGEEAVRAARSLLRTLPIPSGEFAFGRTRVFVRSPRTVWELEALRAARVERLVSAAQRAWRDYRARRRHTAQRTIASAWRAHKARQESVEDTIALQPSYWRPGAPAAPSPAAARAAAGLVVWRAWCSSARRRYLRGLWARLPARHCSPVCTAWPPPPAPRLLARTDSLLRRLHHRWRCQLYRQAFDQTARNRMREKVTASVLFKDRKASYAVSVAHPFVGDYVRLRASGAWRRGAGAGAADRYVVFADAAVRVARGGGAGRVLAVVSTAALLLLEPRSLRVKRRVPAQQVYRLSLSPYADDVLAVHVRAPAAPDDSDEDLSQCSSRDALDAPGCLFGSEGGWRRRGDVVLRTCHVLELATKLFLVVQNAVGAPPHVNIASEFEANFGQQLVTIAFHATGSAPSGARLVRRGSRLDVLL
ncbi:unconventional myosin-Ia-like [Pieris brassicae]|uniref:unconventional myosin-Ia-like n=1 Tax=Pieris brassicae TaxID=7116 RepID=UPI001E6614DB|nr:unconventional myosin-Ia-like [Pieris brassicae]XP_045514736.1 unconventional myosin-Ia-like [Pieris brassicae]